VKAFSSKRRIAAAALLLLGGLYFLRPGASRLKSRVISSLSAATRRPVDVGSVHLRLLPRPGFDLENVVVYDDPLFGAEPMLRASQVTADLRLISLLRGRLEIARLELTEPSLNLVHSKGGSWNLEALLEHSAHTPLAPTAKTRLERRPGFPYIEGSSARINFKSGAEKLPYSLTNADFSLWQDSENSWGVRLKAQPVRTDLNLTDTGLVQLNGTWQRAERFQDTPLAFHFTWTRAQLGQMTKFFAGNDKGWRGAIQADVAFEGTPANLQAAGTASIDDFRRFDLSSAQGLRLAASCHGTYSSLTHEFPEVECSAPVGKGLLSLSGEIGFPGSRHFSLAVSAENVPAGAISSLAQRAKKNLPDDLAVDGLLQGKISLSEVPDSGSFLQIEGRGEIAGFRLSSKTVNAEIGRQDVPFVVASDGRRGSWETPARSRTVNPRPGTQGSHLELGPIAFEPGRTGGALARGWLGRSGYSLAVSGETEISRLLRMASAIGLPAMAARPEGSAQVDLLIRGAWTKQSGASITDFAGAQVTGTARVRDVRTAIRGAGGPVEILAAEIELLPDKVHIDHLNARAAGSSWQGSLDLARGCASPETCPVHFRLATDRSSLAQLNQWANPSPKKRAWYQVLGGNTPAPASLLSRVHASGKLTADGFDVRAVSATHVSADITLDAGRLRVSGLQADLLGGKHRGSWQADFTSKPALCGGSGEFSELSLTRLAALMQDAWMTGTANAIYEIKGPCSAEFWPSAEGKLEVDMRNGTFPHISLGGDPEPFQVMRLRGQARWSAGEVEIGDAVVDSQSGTYQLTGTATFERAVTLKMTGLSGTTSGYAISGTLDAPLVTPLARTEQARLKPPLEK
jgi:AsmA family